MHNHCSQIESVVRICSSLKTITKYFHTQIVKLSVNLSTNVLHCMDIILAKWRNDEFYWQEKSVLKISWRPVNSSSIDRNGFLTCPQAVILDTWNQKTSHPIIKNNNVLFTCKYICHMFTPICGWYHPWKFWLYTSAITSQWIITQCCWNNVRHFCIEKVIEKLCKDRNGVVTCDKKNLQWIGNECYYYPTRCVFSIPRQGSGIENTYKCNPLNKIISNPEPWEILYISTVY